MRLNITTHTNTLTQLASGTKWMISLRKHHNYQDFERENSLKSHQPTCTYCVHQYAQSNWINPIKWNIHFWVVRVWLKEREKERNESSKYYPSLNMDTQNKHPSGNHRSTSLLLWGTLTQSLTLTSLNATSAPCLMSAFTHSTDPFMAAIWRGDWTNLKTNFWKNSLSFSLSSSL